MPSDRSEDNAPLGEASTGGVVLLAALVQVVQALGGGLAGRARDLNSPLVHLDAGDNALLAQHLYEWRAILASVEQRLLVADGSRDVLAQARRGEQELAVVAAVLLGVLHVDTGEALGNGTGGLISGKDALTRSGDSRLQRETTQA